MTAPFFMAGSPRSGTTLLRNILRTSSALAAPEETHFYRWSSPYKSATYRARCGGRILVRHREIDGVTEDEFWDLFATSNSRRELQDRYVARFLEVQGLQGRQWFDKTPQNSYGLHLLLPDYPDSTIVHIARHPVAVVASLIRGEVLKADGIDEAIEHWREPTRTLLHLSEHQPDRVLTFTYNELVRSLPATLELLGTRVAFDPSTIDPSAFGLRSDPRAWDDALSPNEADYVIERCQTELEQLDLDDCV